MGSKSGCRLLACYHLLQSVCKSISANSHRQITISINADTKKMKCQEFFDDFYVSVPYLVSFLLFFPESSSCVACKAFCDFSGVLLGHFRFFIHSLDFLRFPPPVLLSVSELLSVEQVDITVGDSSPKICMIFLKGVTIL